VGGGLTSSSRDPAPPNSQTHIVPLTRVREAILAARRRRRTRRGLSLDHNLRRRTPGAYALELLAHLHGDVAIDLRMGAVGFGRDHRKAGIRFFANGHMQRHFAEERDAETF